MALKLEDILKAKGYTDADLEALKPMLADAKFRSTLESTLDEVSGDRDKFKGEAEGWSSWYKDTGLPTVEKALQREQEARSQAAGYEARLRTLQEQGLIKVAENNDPNPNPNPKPEEKPAPFDPKAHNLVTHEDVARFADAEGRAIAMAADLNEEYRQLFGGKSLYEYTAEVDGRTLRGLTALRHEAIAAKIPIDQYVANKFKFGEKREELRVASVKKVEDDIRADQRSKDIAELVNPNARSPVASRSPLIPRPTQEGKQPWEMPDGRNQDERVTRVVQKILQ